MGCTGCIGLIGFKVLSVTRAFGVRRVCRVGQVWGFKGFYGL